MMKIIFSGEFVDKMKKIIFFIAMWPVQGFGSFFMIKKRFLFRSVAMNWQKNA